ncbi:hypothetical protein LEP1GSC072_2020 [Leptospira noguchii str. Bonito]|nr:hypothetical protein LEP1GSC072_2020 [Leptospira noguchii str. Bonito]
MNNATGTKVSPKILRTKLNDSESGKNLRKNEKSKARKGGKVKSFFKTEVIRFPFILGSFWKCNARINPGMARQRKVPN